MDQKYLKPKSLIPTGLVLWKPTMLQRGVIIGGILYMAGLFHCYKQSVMVSFLKLQYNFVGYCKNSD